MKIICCAIYYPSNEPYSGTVANIKYGELYVTSRAHNAVYRWVYRMHRESVDPLPKATMGYLVRTDAGTLEFRSRNDAAGASNCKSHGPVYSYDVIWDLSKDDVTAYALEASIMNRMLEAHNIQLEY